MLSLRPPADPIIEITGPFGKYQFVLCSLIFLTKIFTAFHQMAILFLNPKLKYTCDGVSMKCPCSDPVFDKTIFSNTLAMEWTLVCDRLFLASVQQGTFQFGVLLGSIGFGMAADRVGRKIPLMISISMQITCGIGAGLTTNYWVFLILRIFLGMSVGGAMTTSFVIVMEFIGPQYRELISALYQVPFNVGTAFLPVIAYFIRDYHKYQLVLSTPGIVMLSCFWCPETPRWLIAVNKTDRAINILTKAAKMNNRPTENVKSLIATYQAHLGAQKAAKGTIADLFKTPNIRKNIMCVAFNWLACSYCFYGVSQYVGQLTGNPFLNVGASAVLTTVATLLSIPIMKVIGRRTILIIGNGTAATCLILLGILPESMSNGPISIILAIIGVMSSFTVFTVVYLYTSELFPTVVRNAAVGLASSSARVGSIIAPFVVETQHKAKWLPPVLFATLPAIACIISFLLPETKGCPLMTTIAEAEAFGKGTKRQAKPE